MAQEELDGLGLAAAPPLRALLADEAQPIEIRMQAVYALGRLGAPTLAELVDLAIQSPSVDLRKAALYALADCEADWPVPRIALRLKYEKDPEARLWLARFLARHQNASGLPVLFDLTRFETEALQSRAFGVLSELETQEGAPSAELYQAWLAADPAFWQKAAISPALERELWLQIDQLSSEHFQLRGVDDARMVLTDLGTWATPALADCLADNDPYVRLHAAQVLGRRGPRAAAAADALWGTLGDAQVAPTALAALAQLGRPEVFPRLADIATAESHGLALRTAAIEALAGAPTAEQAPALRTLLTAAPDGPLAGPLRRTLLVLAPNAALVDALTAQLTHPHRRHRRSRPARLARSPRRRPPRRRPRGCLVRSPQTAPGPGPEADMAWRTRLRQWLPAQRDALLALGQ
ncbi:MAG: hypothetical protein R3F17_06485 [Planctomycetota bacterium]